MRPSTGRSHMPSGPQRLVSVDNIVYLELVARSPVGGTGFSLQDMLDQAGPADAEEIPGVGT